MGCFEWFHKVDFKTREMFKIKAGNSCGIAPIVSDDPPVVTQKWLDQPTRYRNVVIFDEGDAFIWEEDEDLKRFNLMVKYWLKMRSFVIILTATPFFSKGGSFTERQLL